MNEAENTYEINDVVKNIVLPNIALQVKNEDVAFPYLAGAPGGGKTTIIKTMCEDRNWGLISTHFALKPLEETGGLPQFRKFKFNNQEILGTVWSFPDIMQQLYTMSQTKKIIVWLLDDVHLCTFVHMGLLYELLTERKLRGYKIPDNVAIVLAGNHNDNKAGAKTMFSAIMNRILLLPIHTSYINWKKNFAIKHNLHPAILSFFNEMNEQFFHEDEQVNCPWGSPRSWTRFSNFLVQLEKNDKIIPSDKLLYIAQAHVSKEAASEFVQYYKIMMQFDVKKILKEADDFQLPESNVDKYAMLFTLLYNYSNRKDPNEIINPFSKIVYKYIKDSPDLGILAIHEIIDIEKILNKRNLYMRLVDNLNTIEPGITSKLLKGLQNV